jgi:glyceraldehyde-3-phosphate dehydrogenase (NADP+)
MKSGKVDTLALIGEAVLCNCFADQHPNKNRLRLILGLEAKTSNHFYRCRFRFWLSKNEHLRSLSFNGQRCTALKTMYVHETIAGELNRRFAAKVALIFGNPRDKSVMLTPLPEKRKPAYSYSIDDATQVKEHQLIKKVE